MCVLLVTSGYAGVLSLLVSKPPFDGREAVRRCRPDGVAGRLPKAATILDGFGETDSKQAMGRLWMRPKEDRRVAVDMSDAKMCFLCKRRRRGNEGRLQSGNKAHRTAPQAKAE